MDYELTEDEINHICMYLRLIDLLKKNEDKVKGVDLLNQEYQKLCESVKKLTEHLSEAQLDKILEIHKIQSAFINKKRKSSKKKAADNT